MQIINSIKKIKIPGDTIVIPMFIGCTINSLFPQILHIGGFTTAIIDGTAPLVGVFMFFIGATLSFGKAPRALFRGGVIISVKIAIAVLLGLAVAAFFNNNFLGLSSIAIIGAMSVANNALYSGITATYGDEIDRGAVAMTTISVGPTVTMIALNANGQASIPFWAIIGSILPLFIGMLLANSSSFLKKHLTAGVTPIIIILGFVLGANMNFAQLVEGGLSGILLGLIVVFIGGAFGILSDKLTGGSGVAGAAINSTAASAVATPAAMVNVDPGLASVASIATPQIAASVIISAILTPIVTNWVYKRNQAKRNKVENVIVGD
ncbi:2-keto-3-deoxygluconate permease [Sporolactobacillus terrae]|uniref:2-keto-3-deoxygluconate permease n=1 Tax=Sporolactobacillus terrae TaxID=269673 RepID=UPI00048D1856|nr:2-keto-3-deoxygluconate permease [Sporolactobacillus terrae]